jgi:hypothetical protein
LREEVKRAHRATQSGQWRQESPSRTTLFPSPVDLARTKPKSILKKVGEDREAKVAVSKGADVGLNYVNGSLCLPQKI